MSQSEMTGRRGLTARYVWITVIAVAIAGFIHLVLAPEHYGHGAAHGIFFALAGTAEILWAVMFWRRPSTGLYYTGLLLVGGLVILWTITRVTPGPFEHDPGAIDFSGLVCKASEFVGIAALIVLAVQGGVAGLAGGPLSRVTGDALAMAIIGGLGFFMVGQAAEPLLPSLGHADDHAGVAAAGHSHSHDEITAGRVRLPSTGAMNAGDLVIEEVWARPAAAGENGVIYLHITNTGHDPDRLLGAATSAASTVELHRSRLEGDVMSMEPVPGGLDLPPESEVVLEPGGYHFMLIDLQQDLTPGGHIHAALQFEHAGEVEVEVQIVQP